MSTAALTNDNVSPARNPRGMATHLRICEVASSLFFERGFSPVTMEEVAQAAAIRRSTLYMHFRDKEEILAEIADIYTRKLRPVVDRLPGPAPTHDELVAWVEDMAEFVSSERAATEILVSLSHLPQVHPAALAFGHELMRMMAGRLAAFRRALEPGQPLAFAWTISTLDSLGWALRHHARAPGSEVARCRLAVAAELLDRLVRDDLEKGPI